MTHLTQLLAGLKQGVRCWFWFSPQVHENDPMLFLTTLKDDPSMEKLNMLTKDFALPLGARVFIGFASMEAAGHMNFGAVGLQSEHLENLAAWVSQHIDTYPDLAYLKNACLVELTARGKVVQQYQ